MPKHLGSRLRNGPVDGGPDIISRIPIPNIVDNADNCDIRVLWTSPEAESTTDRIPAAEVPSSERLIHDRHGRSGTEVVLVEITAGL
jgi:hypothetical protein